MLILPTDIQDDIQNGHQSVYFSDNSPKILKIKIKMQILLCWFTRNQLEKHNEALNLACNIFLLSKPRNVEKMAQKRCFLSFELNLVYIRQLVQHGRGRFNFTHFISSTI